MIINFPSSEYQTIAYPGGEFQVRLTDPTAVREAKRCIIRASIHSAEEALQLVLLADAIRFTLGTEKPIDLCLPYLPYARGDRRFVDGDCHGLRVFARMLNMAAFSSISVLDVHNLEAAKIEFGYLRNIAPDGLIRRALADFDEHSGGNAAILWPDAGAAVRYGKIAARLGRAAFTASKKRDSATGKLVGFDVPDIPQNVSVLMVDDLCDGGGTFIGIADTMKHSRDKLGLYVTHSIFSKGVDVLKQNFGRIYTTDSFPLLTALRFDVTTYGAFEYMIAPGTPMPGVAVEGAVERPVKP